MKALLAYHFIPQNGKAKRKRKTDFDWELESLKERMIIYHKN